MQNHCISGRWAICEQQLGAEHPYTAMSLNNLATLYRYQGNYVQAEPLYQRVLSMRERQLGAEHPRHSRQPLRPGDSLSGYQEQLLQAEAVVSAGVAYPNTASRDHSMQRQ